MRLEPRDHCPWWLLAAAPLGALAVALVLCGLLLVWAGAPLTEAYPALLRGALGSRFAISETLTRATPLIFTGLAVAVAFRAKLWNIGAEGQLYAGALAATGLGSGLLALPAALMIPLLFGAGALAGGLVLLFSAWLKLRLRVDEVVTTLMLNYVVLLLVSYLVFGPWKDPMAMGWPQAMPVVDEGILPVLWPRTRLHLGLPIALAAAFLVWLLMDFSRWGLEIRALGLNAGAAVFAGVPLGATVLRTALLSGGLAACAGVSELAGTKGYLTLDMSPGYGYTGIAVAMLAGLHPLGVVAAALAVAAIYNGADSMSRGFGVSSYLADVMTASGLLAMLVGLLLIRYRWRWA